jgi:hypothetical protein
MSAGEAVTLYELSGCRCAASVSTGVPEALVPE